MIKINEKLQHLDGESIVKLMEMYYSGHKTATELIELYNIKTTPSNLFKLFPEEQVMGKKCIYCESNMYVKRPSKTSFNRNINIPFCPSCGHEESYRCKCEGCITNREIELRKREKERQEEIARKKKLIYETYNLSNSVRCKLDGLKFLDKLYLASVCRVLLSEDGVTTIPLDDFDDIIAPNDKVYDILRYLYHNNIILVSPTSDINAFEDGENFPSTFYLSRVKFHINVEYNNDKMETVREILSPTIDLQENLTVAYNIWREIALGECLDYLIYQMGKVGFNFSIGDKTISVINELLDSFSVSQIYSIIYKAITNATRYYQEGGISKKQAANSVVSRCQGFGERALIDGWELTRYKRIKELPQSSLSKVLFNKLYKIGDKCIDEVPSVEILNDSII